MVHLFLLLVLAARLKHPDIMFIANLSLCQPVMQRDLEMNVRHVHPLSPSEDPCIGKPYEGRCILRQVVQANFTDYTFFGSDDGQGGLHALGVSAIVLDRTIFIECHPQTWVLSSNSLALFSGIDAVISSDSFIILGNYFA
jgi:hypothetical protein